MSIALRRLPSVRRQPSDSSIFPLTFDKELLTDKLPFFKYANTHALVMAKLNGETPKRYKHPNIPKPLWKLLERSWSYEPSLRPTMDVIVDQVSYVSNLLPDLPHVCF